MRVENIDWDEMERKSETFERVCGVRTKMKTKFERKEIDK